MMGSEDYRRRINLVMDSIRKNLGSELRLDDLAKVACFSAYHFHRIFRSQTGETLGEFIRRQRLEKAAEEMIHRGAGNLTSLSLEVGFGSLAAFTRAFKDYFGKTPSQWRAQDIRNYRSPHGRPINADQDSNFDQINSNPSKAELSDQEYPFDKSSRRIIMNPKIENMEETKVVYWRAVGEYSPDGAIGNAWQQAYNWAGARGIFENRNWALYGISLDDPYIAPKDKCRYDACVAIPEEMVVVDQNIQTLPSGKLAVFPFQGKNLDLGPFFDRIFKEWLPQSGFVPADAPCFERYQPSHPMDPESKEMACDICVPVVPS